MQTHTMHTPPPQMACEEVYCADKLYDRRRSPGQIKKVYEAFQGERGVEGAALRVNGVLATL